jgi:hypothetical protein
MRQSPTSKSTVDAIEASAKHVCALLDSFGLVTLKLHERSAISSVKTRDRKGIKMPRTTPQQNKALVMEGFYALFRRDYAATE